MCCDVMRLMSLFFSLVLHAVVITAGMYSSMGSSLHIDLGKRVYTVDLVTLAPSGSKQPGQKTSGQKKSAPSKKAVSGIPAPVHPVAKRVAKISPPKKNAPVPGKKISQRKSKATPSRVRKAPAKKKAPSVSSKQVLAQALKGVQRQVAGQERQNRSALAKELAGLQKQVGTDVGAGSGGKGSGLIQVYGQLAESAIKEHWRFPRVGGDNLMVRVEVRIDHTGKVLQSKILSSSGRPDFDASAQRAVQETGQLPKPPSETIRRLIINFNLNELEN